MEPVMICRSCFYYTDAGLCRNDQKKKSPNYVCADYKIRLADHYIPNMWDDWKKKAQQQQPNTRQR